MIALLPFWWASVWSYIAGPVEAIGGAFVLGGVWVNFLYMRKSMVTKKDLENAMLKRKLEQHEAMSLLADSVSKHFVTRRECAATHRGDGNGSNGHAKQLTIL